MNKELLKKLLDKGIKCTEEDVIFVTEDKSGQLVWLERGTLQAGYLHIVNRHSQDFKSAFGISTNEIPAWIEKVITYGTIVSEKIKVEDGIIRKSKIYDYDGEYYMLSAIGDNGFIVSAYPARKE